MEFRSDGAEEEAAQVHWREHIHGAGPCARRHSWGVGAQNLIQNLVQGHSRDIVQNVVQGHIGDLVQNFIEDVIEKFFQKQFEDQRDG